MVNESRLNQLVGELQHRQIDRRTFFVRAMGLGLSIGAVSRLLGASGVAAQEGPTTAAEIGMTGIPHITTTDKGTIKLYSSWPMTGDSSKIGPDAAEGIRLALEVFGNAAGGFALEYEALDDGIAANNGAWDGPKESENANSVVNDADAMVYVATFNSGAAKVSIPILNQVTPGPMAMISGANTYPGLTKESEYNEEEGEPDMYYPSGTRNYMRVVPADDIQGAAAANWAYTTKGARKAYVLHDNQLYGKGVAAVFEGTFKQLGGEVLGFEGYDIEAPDYQALFAGIAESEPDLVYLGAIVNLNASKLLIDMRAIMPDVTFLGPDGLNNAAFIEGAGDAAEGAFITYAGLPTTELAKLGGPGADWVTQMTERLGEAPDSYAAYAYEAAVVAIQAIDKVQAKDRAAILDAMFTTSEFHGLLGTWSFTETGDTDALTMSLNIVQGGEVIFQEPIGV